MDTGVSYYKMINLCVHADHCSRLRCLSERFSGNKISGTWKVSESSTSIYFCFTFGENCCICNISWFANCKHNRVHQRNAVEELLHLNNGVSSCR